MKKQEKDYNIFDWWKKVVLENYANFKGRARRKEYWSFQLVNLLILIIPYGIVLATVISGEQPGLMIGLLSFVVIAFALGTLIPSLAVIVRRLHDRDRSGWFYFISFIPLIGGFWILYEFFSVGSIGKNNYGNDPKIPHNELSEIGVPQE